MTPLEVVVRKIADGFMLSLKGELDLTGAEELARELVRLDKHNPKVIVLDLRELRFIDSSGLRVVVSADMGARRSGRRLVIVEGPEVVQRVFRHTLLDQRLDFVEDIEE